MTTTATAKPKRKSIDDQAKRYILAVLAEEIIAESGGNPSCGDCIEYMRDRFQSEMGWDIDRSGRQKAMQNWLQGLAIPIEFWNSGIVELAQAWGSLPENPTETQQDKIIENYFPMMATKALQLLDGYRVPKD